METFQIKLYQKRVALKTLILLKLPKSFKIHVNLFMRQGKQVKNLKHMEDSCSIYQIILYLVFFFNKNSFLAIA